MRRSVQMVIGTVVGVGLLILMAIPASANSSTVGITGGAFTLYGPFGSPTGVAPLPGPTCASTNTVSATASAASMGVFQASIDHTWILEDPFGNSVDYIASFSMALLGTYTGNGSDIQFQDQVGTMTVQAQADGCTPNPWPGTCTITASGLDAHSAITSQVTSGTLPTSGVGDTIRLAGENVEGETTVTDTGSVCSFLVFFDLGTFVFDFDELEVVSVP